MKKTISILLVILSIIISNSVSAAGESPVTTNAKASITGKVVDNKTGESLAGVAISVEGTEVKVYSDMDGAFTINNMDAGNYNLVLSLISYKNSLVENLKLQPSEKEVIDIKLNAIR